MSAIITLPSSSDIVTVAWGRLPSDISVGNEIVSIVSRKLSILSTTLSSVIGMLIALEVCPLENVTVYGPDL